MVFTMSGAALDNDPRRFGSMECVATDALSETGLWGNSAEPVSASFTAEVLAWCTAVGRSSRLCRTAVVAKGNIYEVLHRARIGPRARAGSLCRGRGRRPRCRALASRLTAILQKAIEAGGSARDFTSPGGHAGLFPSSSESTIVKDCGVAVVGATVDPCIQRGAHHLRPFTLPATVRGRVGDRASRTRHRIHGIRWYRQDPEWTMRHVIHPTAMLAMMIQPRCMGWCMLL